MLRLSDQEAQAVDEYVDDSVPPLSDIMERWKSALNNKGRIPFQAYPDDPFRAAHRDDVDVLKKFFAGGLEPNHVNEVGYTPLMAAVRGEALEATKFLLKKGASATIADKRGFTPLYWSVSQTPVNATTQVTIVKILLDAGADVNALNENGGTALMTASWFGCEASVKVLLSRGADASIRDQRGRTAQALAIERGHQFIAGLL